MKSEIRDQKSEIPLVLASASPRRRELLSAAGIPFTVTVADIVEQRRLGEASLMFALRLAREKAEAVLHKIPQQKAVRVLGADTIVVVPEGDQVLGKPRDAEDALCMLRLLSGREHQVITAVCLLAREHDGKFSADLRHAVTSVRFRDVSDSEMRAYVATGEPLDKAGGYGIQGGASQFIAGYEGDYDNVVGLPVALVREMLGQ